MSLQLAVLICVVVQLCMGDQPVEEVITTKKVPRLGDWTEKSTEAADVKEATEYAVQAFNSGSRGKKIFKLVSITSAQVQVTNMINFMIDAVLRKTKCRKDENHDLKSCSFEKKEVHCRFIVRFDPREDKYSLEHHKCRRTENKA